MNKRKVTRYTKDISGDIDGLSIKQLKEFIGQYQEDYILDIGIENDYDYPRVSVHFSWREEETDKEYSYRLAREQILKESKRETYLRLKKEFDGE